MGAALIGSPLLVRQALQLVPGEVGGRHKEGSGGNSQLLSCALLPAIKTDTAH